MHPGAAARVSTDRAAPVNAASKDAATHQIKPGVSIWLFVFPLLPAEHSRYHHAIRGCGLGRSRPGP